MKVVVDSETGEVLRELNDYDRILSNSVYKNLKNSKSIKFNDFITFNSSARTRLRRGKSFQEKLQRSISATRKRRSEKRLKACSKKTFYISMKNKSYTSIRLF